MYNGLLSQVSTSPFDNKAPKTASRVPADGRQKQIGGIFRDGLGTFLINLIESVVIVVAILMLTMGFRSGMIIGISLVVTVVGSFLILGMADGTMQRVSLAAFILAMGMLVDNAIVIVDGILIDLKLGKPRREAMTSRR